MKLLRTQAVLLALTTLCSASLGGEGDKAAPAKVLPVLKPDAALLARIAALPDNTWLKLPPIKTTGDLKWANADYKRLGPMVRDYCNKMVWAPERKRAIYAGAGHNVHPYNDVWEYDLASNTWVCLYGVNWVFKGVGRKTPLDEAVAKVKGRVVLKDGVVTTADGAPVRPAHTWWGLCYDSDRKKMIFWDAHKGLLFTNRKLLAAALGLKPNDPVLQGTGGSGAGITYVFTFDPATRKWGKVRKGAPKAYESSELEYLPDRKKLWLHTGRTYLSDPVRGAWKPSAKGGPRSGALTAYDPETKQVVAVVFNKTYVYSCDSGQWKLATEDLKDTAVVPVSTFCYDTAARQFVLYTHARRKDKAKSGPRLWLFDHRAGKWTKPEPAGAAPKMGGVAGYYDSARNVTVIYKQGQTWVYRAKKAAKAKGSKKG